MSQLISVRAASLEWSAPASPDERIRYDHVLAKSALGEFSIEWKSWKEHDDFAVYLDGDFLTSEYSIEKAKAFVQGHLDAIVCRLILGAKELDSTTDRTAPQGIMLPAPELVWFQKTDSVATTYSAKSEFGDLLILYISELRWDLNLGQGIGADYLGSFETLEKAMLGAEKFIRKMRERQGGEQ